MQVQRRGGAANGLTLKGSAMEFMHTKLENGLVVIGERNEAAQSMACGYFVKTGSRDETPDVSGVSHFLEHMIFKGGDRRSADDIKREFDELGAQYNAFTSTENTVYFGRVLPECQPRLIDLLTDMMRPALRNDDFDVEKKVILEEIAMYKDEPASVAYWAALELFANGHPSGNSVLGTTESISALERDQMMSYFERRYSPGNLMVALTGAFDWDAAVRQIDEATRGWVPFDVGRETPALECAVQTKVMQNDQFTREHLFWFWPGLNIQDERRRAADILAGVLGDSVGSRLYWGLVDPGDASYASMGHSAQDRFGTFRAYASCDSERAVEVVQKVQDILKDAVENGVSEDEIERAKQKGASSTVLRSETPMERLVPVGMAWAYRGEYIDTDEEVNRLLAVTKEDLDALLAEDPFSKGALVALGPLETLEA